MMKLIVNIIIILTISLETYSQYYKAPYSIKNRNTSILIRLSPKTIVLQEDSMIYWYLPTGSAIYATLNTINDKTRFSPVYKNLMVEDTLKLGTSGNVYHGLANELYFDSYNGLNISDLNSIWNNVGSSFFGGDLSGTYIGTRRNYLSTDSTSLNLTSNALTTELNFRMDTNFYITKGGNYTNPIIRIKKNKTVYFNSDTVNIIGQLYNKNGNNYIMNQPYSIYQNFAGAAHLFGSESIGAGVMQKSADTSAGLVYQNATVTRKIAAHRTFLQMYFDRNATSTNEFRINTDTAYIYMNNNMATVWDNTGKLWQKKNAFFEKNLMVYDTLKLGVNGRVQQEISNDGYITQNDTINRFSFAINPAVDITTGNIYNNHNYLSTIVNKSGLLRYYRGINELSINLTNKNDSINQLRGIMSNVNNNQGYAHILFGVNSNTYTDASKYGSNARAKTNQQFGGYYSTYVYNSINNNSTSICRIDFGNSIYSVYGGYGTTQVDSAKSLDIRCNINAQTSANTTITTLKNINIDTKSLYTAGTRTVTNMYGIYLLNESGLTGTTNHFGIYENYGKNYFTNKVQTASDVVIAATKAYYLGDENTDGSWRINRNGNNLTFERRELGVWVIKSTLIP